MPSLIAEHPLCSDRNSNIKDIIAKKDNKEKRMYKGTHHACAWLALVNHQRYQDMALVNKNLVVGCINCTFL